MDAAGKWPLLQLRQPGAPGPGDCTSEIFAGRSPDPAVAHCGPKRNRATIGAVLVDELPHVLPKIRELRVAARPSAFTANDHASGTRFFRRMQTNGVGRYPINVAGPKRRLVVRYE